MIVLAAFATNSRAQSSRRTSRVAYKHVQAIFDKNCVQCHHPPKPRAMMDLTSYAGVMKGNDDGSVITPGHPEKSYLYQLVSWTGRKKMPPSAPLSKADLAAIGAWIKAGAKK